MEAAFYIAAFVAVVATAMIIVSLNAVHALLNLVVSLLAVAVMFYVLGAPFAAALEVVIYAGAIVVLFVFVVMMLNLGKAGVARERSWLKPSIWIAPSVLAAVLLFEMVYIITQAPTEIAGHTVVGPKQVGIFLFGPYLLTVELGSLLLLAALIAAYHLGRRWHWPHETE